MRRIEFTVHGQAQTAGSKRAFPYRKSGGAMGVRVSDANPQSREWKGIVASAGAEAMEGPMFDGAVGVVFRFVVVRPKGHFGSGRNAGTVKASAPKHPTVRPDVLKLARAAEDALTGIVWRDDSQIVHELLVKEYGESARLDVTVLEFDLIDEAENSDDGQTDAD